MGGRALCERTRADGGAGVAAGGGCRVGGFSDPALPLEGQESHLRREEHLEPHETKG